MNIIWDFNFTHINAFDFNNWKFKSQNLKMDLGEIDLGEFGRQLFFKILQETSSEGEFHELLKRWKDKQKQYNDESFPPNRSSLITYWEDESVRDKVQKWKYFVWKRASEFMDPDQMCIFKDKIEPDDVKQGVLGDWYFMSSLSVLAEQPERIIELFESHEVNAYGIYAIRLWKNGEWRTVIIDDFFPCKGLTPVFSRAHGDELWVMLLEKAWAKVHGSYERIEAGYAENVLRDLTGAPTKVFTHDDKELWDNMLRAKENNFLMAGSAGSTKSSKELLEEMGLIGYHSYGILDVREVATMEGMEKLIKLRNPWGDFEWTGDWSDQSPNWTDDLKKELNFQNIDDGTFWMSFVDFTHYFSRVQICCIRDGYKYTSFKAYHEKGSWSIIRMVLEEDAEIYLSINQKDKRCFSRNQNYEYSNARLIVAKIEEDGELDYQYGKMGVDREVWEEYTFTAGDYLCYVEVDWQTEEINHFVLSSYGSSEAHFIRDEKGEHPDFLEKVFMSCAYKYGRKTTFESEGAEGCVKYHQMLPEGYGYNFFCNCFINFPYFLTGDIKKNFCKLYLT